MRQGGRPSTDDAYREGTLMADMQVIVRHQDRGALRLDHLHDQALCEPEGRGDLLITHIMPNSGRCAVAYLCTGLHLVICRSGRRFSLFSFASRQCRSPTLSLPTVAPMDCAPRTEHLLCASPAGRAWRTSRSIVPKIERQQERDASDHAPLRVRCEQKARCCSGAAGDGLTQPCLADRESGGPGRCAPTEPGRRGR